MSSASTSSSPSPSSSSTTTSSSPSSPPPICIIGSGPCGLGAAFRLHEISQIHPTLSVAQNWHLFDASPTPGGLAMTLKDSNGFLWDIGGHVIFSHFAYFSSLLDSLIPNDQWNFKVREAWVRMRDTWIPYPFQQNIHRLPDSKEVDHIVSSLLSLEKSKTSGTPPSVKNFSDWLIQSFGEGLCSVFMFPYNYKVWAYKPSEMNCEWMGERVATVNTQRVISNVIAKRDELGWGPNNTFRFPLYGGTGNIWKRLYDTLPQTHITLGKTLIEISVDNKTLHFSDGSIQPFSQLVSSMPLDELVKITKGKGVSWGSDEKVSSALSQRFRYSTSHIIGIGLRGSPPPSLSSKCWIYFPEESSPFYRATVFSNYSPHVCPNPSSPDGQWSLMCEVSESKEKSLTWPHPPGHFDEFIKKGGGEKSLPYDKDSQSPISKYIIHRVLEGLVSTGLLPPSSLPSSLLSVFHRSFPHGYPTPFLGRDSLINSISSELEINGIYSRGRFGRWCYEVSNQDHSMMQGVEVIDKILFGVTEMTINYSEIVNKGNDKTGRIPNEQVLKGIKEKMKGRDINKR